MWGIALLKSEPYCSVGRSTATSLTTCSSYCRALTPLRSAGRAHRQLHATTVYEKRLDGADVGVCGAVPVAAPNNPGGGPW